MFFDAVCLAFVWMQLLLFSLGTRQLISRSLKSVTMPYLPFYGSIGLLILSTSGLLGGLFDIKMIPFLALLALLVQVLGVLRLPAYLVDFGKSAVAQPLNTAMQLFIVSLSAGFWSFIFSDLAVLNSRSDGIAHLNFLSLISHSGMPLLDKIPVPFGHIFGDAMNEFYPTGSHTIVSAFGYYYWRFGLVTLAQLLKAWHACVLSGTSVIMYGAVVFLFPRKKYQYLAFILALVTIFYRSFPAGPAYHSGFSRLAGYVFIFPLIVAGLTYSSRRQKSMDALVLISLLGVPGVFFYHAGALGVFGIAYLSFFVMRFLTNVHKPRVWFRNLTKVAMTLALSFFILQWIAAQTHSFSIIDVSNPIIFNTFSAVFRDLCLERISTVILKIFASDHEQVYGLISFILIFLSCSGLIALIFFNKKLRIPIAIRFYVLFSFFAILGLLLTYYVPLQSVYRLGLIYLHKEHRFAEACFFPLCLTWVCGLKLVHKTYRALLLRYQPIPWLIVTLRCVFTSFALLLFLGIYQSFRAAHTDAYFFWRENRGPLHAETDGIVPFIKQHTDRKALFIYEAGLLDSLQGLTDREALFQYGECPPERSENCYRRMAFFAEIYAELEETIRKPDASKACFIKLNAFERDVYLITPFSILPYRTVPYHFFPYALCKDLTAIGKFGKFLVWHYKN